MMRYVPDNEISNRSDRHRMRENVARQRALNIGHIFKQGFGRTTDSLKFLDQTLQSSVRNIDIPGI